MKELGLLPVPTNWLINTNYLNITTTFANEKTERK